jgi:hypothetical protein
MIYFHIIIKIVMLMGMYKNNSTVSGNLSLRTNDGRDEIWDLFANKCMFVTLDTRKVELLAYRKRTKLKLWRLDKIEDSMERWEILPFGPAI